MDFNMQFIKNEIKGWGIERWNLQGLFLCLNKRLKPGGKSFLSDLQCIYLVKIGTTINSFTCVLFVNLITAKSCFKL